jgi:hypothetical protein
VTDYAVAPARVGLWLDCDTIGTLTPSRIAAAMAHVHPTYGKVQGIEGYSELPNERVDGTIWTADSLAMVVAAGAQALWIQHPLAPGWIPSENLGAIHEEHASAYAASCGFPMPIHGGVDIEGTAGPSYGYGLTWATNRVQRGGKCMGYYGYQLGMSLADFAAMANVTAYWEAFNQPRIGGRGPCLVQGPTLTIPGFGAVDTDLMAADLKGELPMVCQAA